MPFAASLAARAGEAVRDFEAFASCAPALRDSRLSAAAFGPRDARRRRSMSDARAFLGVEAVAADERAEAVRSRARFEVLIRGHRRLRVSVSRATTFFLHPFERERDGRETLAIVREPAHDKRSQIIRTRKAETRKDDAGRTANLALAPATVRRATTLLRAKVCPQQFPIRRCNVRIARRR
jgi:hypothetical protein